MSKEQDLKKTTIKLLETNEMLVKENMYLKAMTLTSVVNLSRLLQEEIIEVFEEVSTATAENLESVSLMAFKFDELLAKAQAKLNQKRYQSRMEEIYKNKGEKN